MEQKKKKKDAAAEEATAEEVAAEETAGEETDGSSADLEESTTDPEEPGSESGEASAGETAGEQEPESTGEEPPDEAAEEEEPEEPGIDAAREQALRDLKFREKAVAAREMRASAIEELAAQQLPTILADSFSYDSPEAHKKSKEAVVRAFQEALKEAVNQRLRRSTPPKNGSGNPGSGNAKQNSFSEIIRSQRSRR